MIESLLAGFPFLVFFLSLAAAIFACKAHAQAKDNGEVIRELIRRLNDRDGVPGTGAAKGEADTGNAEDGHTR